MEVIHDHRVLNHQIDDPVLCAHLLSVVLPSINAWIKLLPDVSESMNGIFSNQQQVVNCWKPVSKHEGEWHNRPENRFSLHPTGAIILRKNQCFSTV